MNCPRCGCDVQPRQYGAGRWWHCTRACGWWRWRPRPYTGIGSRNTPADALEFIEQAAKHLAAKRWVLRTGHAQSADQAFERGAGNRAEVYLPWPTFEDATPIVARTVMATPTREAHDVAAQHHPTWDTLKHGAKQLHARNAHQVLGPYLDDPVAFVLCWTPGGRGDGGTGQALRIARAHDVTVYDLGSDATRAKVERWIGDDG